MGLAAPSTAAAQSECAAALSAVVDLPLDTSARLRLVKLELERQLGRLTWAEASSRLGPNGGAVLHDTSSGGATTVRLLAQDDTTMGQLVAQVLAVIMEAEPRGFSTGQAVVAADWYRAWRLPPAHALAVLADPRQTIRSRTLATYAVEPHWATRAFVEAAMSGICSLAARSAGLADAAGGQDVETLLDDDEAEFLGWLLRALARAEAQTGSVQTILDATLPPDHPLRPVLHGALQGRQR
jgi:hypothetical protein